MVNQQLRVYAPPVVQRCSELGRHSTDYNTKFNMGWILKNRIFSSFHHNNSNKDRDFQTRQRVIMKNVEKAPPFITTASVPTRFLELLLLLSKDS